MDFHWMKAWRRKLSWCMWKTSSPCWQSSQKGAVFHVPHISLIQPKCSILKLTKQRGSTCPSSPKNRQGCLGWAGAAGQGISTHWEMGRSLNVQGNYCNGFWMRGHWEGQVPLCLQPHQLSHPSIRWLKTSHRNPVSGNRHKHLIIGSSSQFPTIRAETEEEGFFYGKRSFSQEILWLVTSV